MAKFCTKCGKETVDGVCPDCKETKTVAATVAATNGEAVDVKQSFMDCLEVLKGIFTKPFDVIKSFVVDNKFVTGIIMVVLAALSSGLYKIATLKNMYSSSSASSFNESDLSSMISSALSGDLNAAAEPEYLKEFFTTFATNLAEYALLAVLGYVVVSKLFKGTASIKEMISAVGVSLAVVLVANLLNSILVFVDAEFVGYVRSYVATFASITSTLVLAGGVYQAAKLDKNKLFVSVASMSIFATAVMDIVDKLFK